MDGLCPSLYQSGNSLVMGRMKKDSNGRARWVLVRAARAASGSDPGMRELYLRVSYRKGAGKAVVRVANKMGRHHLAYVDGEAALWAGEGGVVQAKA